MQIHLKQRIMTFEPRVKLNHMNYITRVEYHYKVH